jgi:RNA polymerase sigma-70 factor (ECF subfamily)
MEEREWLTERFEEHRTHLRGVAYRMLGSLGEAEDAVQEAWIRVRDQDPDLIKNMRAWLTTIVGRICLNMLRSKGTQSEQLFEVHVPDPIISLVGVDDPEQQLLIADSVGLALQIVLDALPPAERLAFVLHDVFRVPFAEIAKILNRSEVAAQQLASRARRQVQGSPAPDPDLKRQRKVVDAFFKASRDGDFRELLAVLDPEVELRIDGGVFRSEASIVLRGAQAVASQTAVYSQLFPFVKPALVNGTAGAVIDTGEEVVSVMAFTVTNGRIIQIDALVDPERLAAIALALPNT